MAAKGRRTLARGDPMRAKARGTCAYPSGDGREAHVPGCACDDAVGARPHLLKRRNRLIPWIAAAGSQLASLFRRRFPMHHLLARCAVIPCLVLLASCSSTTASTGATDAGPLGEGGCLEETPTM